jgi:hypothetical protein
MIGMTRSADLVLLPLLSLAVASAACAGESARAGADVPADLSGMYTFVGADTGAKIPWAVRAELSLADSTFQFDLRLRVRDEDERETAEGRYVVEGDRLRLVGSDPQHRQSFEFLIRGDSLVMDAGWVAMAALRLVGVPRPVLVKER